jgi:hypothetical protein
MMNFRDKSVLVMDKGMFSSLAELLVPHFGSVGYFCDWQSSFPDGTNLIIGSGLPGVDRVKYLWKQTKENPKTVLDYDLIVFADCWDGDLQEYLRSLGKRVWGSGMMASLELARWATKDQLKEIGLPVNESAQIHGMDNLRVYLKENQNVHVKISTLRGITETFASENYDIVKGKLDDLEARYEGLMEIIFFIVEKDIPDAHEAGYDGYCIDGEFPDNAFYGAEIKNKAYFGKLLDYDELPDQVKKVNTELSYVMDGYRQFWSTELRDEYLIDTTCRHATPAGETYCHAYENLAEILWHGAEGKLVHGESLAQYVAQIVFCSEWAEEHPILIQFPENIRPFVKLYNHCILNGKDWVLPDNQRAKEVGNVIALANTPAEAVKLCKERAEQVKGFMLYSNADDLDRAVKELDTML